MDAYNSPQPMYHDGRYGSAPHTEIGPNRAILWDHPVRLVPAEFVDSLLREGFKLALTLAECSAEYDVPQYVLKDLAKSGVLTTANDRGTDYYVYDRALRKVVRGHYDHLRENKE